MRAFEEFSGKNVLVVGGTGGIGRACVKFFESQGSVVGYTAHRSAVLALTKKDGAGKRSVKHWKVNLNEDKALEELAENVQAELQGLDVVVMCQGVITGKILKDYSFSDIDRVFRVNIISMIKLTKLLQPLMRPNSSIVYLSSISAFAGSYDAVYASTKGAVVSFVKAMARQYGPKIRINAVAPGLTQGTGMYESMKEDTRERHREATALKKLAQPLDIANAVAFLSSASASHISGTCLDVNGGEYLR